MGRDPASVRRGGSRSPLAYLRSLMGRDGAIRYSRTSSQTPVWVTAQALVALAGRTFPLAPVKRAAVAAAPPAATPAPAAAAPDRPAAQPEAVTTAAAVPVPPPAPPRLTPLAVLSRALPAATAQAARQAGVLAAIVTRTWLPAG